MPFAEPIVFVLAILSALVFWELISRTGVVSERDLPAMSTSFNELWSMMQTSHFWLSFADTVRGRAIGLTLATLLAVPTGIALGSSDFLAAAFHIPIEFLRPIPAAALIPVLFLTLGTNLKSEIFLATFGAFRPLLIQTMYRVRDVDPVAIETARSRAGRPRIPTSRSRSALRSTSRRRTRRRIRARSARCCRRERRTSPCRSGRP
jgi:ABC-type nitrate/sulfonate/bicarbonate transport system permease component